MRVNLFLLYKYIILISPAGILYRKRLGSARIESKKQEKAFEDFKKDLDPENVAAWTQQVEAFEKDSTLPDPYYIQPSGKSSSSVHVI